MNQMLCPNVQHPYSMYYFGEEKVHTFKCVVEE